jgi:GTP-binding protein
VLLTKVDKLTRSSAALALSAAQAVLAETCPDSADIGVALFSALKRIGVDDAAMVLHAWAREAQPGPWSGPIA